VRGCQSIACMRNYVCSFVINAFICSQLFFRSHGYGQKAIELRCVPIYMRMILVGRESRWLDVLNAQDPKNLKYIYIYTQIRRTFSIHRQLIPLS
jgi:hypothetical protein